MEINKIQDQLSMADIYKVRVNHEETINMGNAIRLAVIEFVAQQMAKDILENNYIEIMEKISPETIANMAVAEAGAKINETLNKKLPDKIIQIEKNTTQVYQRGLFGGIKRV